MKLSKIVIRYWWFLILLLIAGYFLISNVLENRTHNIETGFALDNTDRIAIISITQAAEQVNLQRTGTGWLVNNQSPASNDVVNALLRVISRLQPAGPVPISMNDTLIGAAQQSGAKIEIFSSRGLILRYWITSDPQANLPNIGYIEGAKRAYQLDLPNYDGLISRLFKTAPEYWIGNLIPTPNLEAINAVQVEVTSDLEQSFRIDITEPGQYRLYHIFSGAELKAFDANRINQFVSRLTQIQYADIANMSEAERAEVVFSEPDFIYTIFSNNSGKYELKVYPVRVEEYMDELGRPVNVDLNKVYVTVSGSKQVFIVNYIDMHEVMIGLAALLS
jgi:hypothetical protein